MQIGADVFHFFFQRNKGRRGFEQVAEIDHQIRGHLGDKLCAAAQVQAVDNIQAVQVKVWFDLKCQIIQFHICTVQFFLVEPDFQRLDLTAHKIECFCHIGKFVFYMRNRQRHTEISLTQTLHSSGNDRDRS